MAKHIIDADVALGGAYGSANAQKIAKLDSNGRVGDSVRLMTYSPTSAGGTEINSIALTNGSGRVGDSERVAGQTLTGLDSRYTPASHVGKGGTEHLIVTSTNAGFMSGAMLDKLNGIATNATKVGAGAVAGDGTIKINDVSTTVYTHPSSHVADILTDGTTKVAYLATERTKLNGIDTQAQKNQLAYSGLIFSGNTASATTTTDTFEIVPGTNGNIWGMLDTSTRKLTLYANGTSSNGGFKISTGFTVLPSPTSAYRNKIIVVEGGVGVADIMYICLKSATDTYTWKQLIIG